MIRRRLVHRTPEAAGLETEQAPSFCVRPAAELSREGGVWWACAARRRAARGSPEPWQRPRQAQRPGPEGAGEAGGAGGAGGHARQGPVRGSALRCVCSDPGQGAHVGRGTAATPQRPRAPRQCLPGVPTSPPRGAQNRRPLPGDARALAPSTSVRRPLRKSGGDAVRAPAAPRLAPWGRAGRVREGVSQPACACPPGGGDPEHGHPHGEAGGRAGEGGGRGGGRRGDQPAGRAVRIVRRRRRQGKWPVPASGTRRHLSGHARRPAGPPTPLALLLVPGQETAGSRRPGPRLCCRSGPGGPWGHRARPTEGTLPAARRGRGGQGPRNQTDGPAATLWGDFGTSVGVRRPVTRLHVRTPGRWGGKDPAPAPGHPHASVSRGPGRGKRLCPSGAYGRGRLPCRRWLPPSLNREEGHREHRGVGRSGPARTPPGASQPAASAGSRLCCGATAEPEL